MAEDRHVAPAAMVATPVLSNAVEMRDGPWSPGRHALHGMTALRRGDAVCGPAYTIRLRRAAAPAAANVDAVLKAYDAAPAGSMVVVDVVDDIGGAAMGDIIAHRLKAIGVAGAVMAGPVRDLLGLEEFGPPIWYMQTTMIGLEMAETQTEVQVELSIGGTRIVPGDLVFADIDGAFVIPAGTIQDIAPIAQVVVDREERWHRGIAAGRTLVEILRSPAS